MNTSGLFINISFYQSLTQHTRRPNLGVNFLSSLGVRRDRAKRFRAPETEPTAATMTGPAVVVASQNPSFRNLAGNFFEIFLRFFMWTTFLLPEQEKENKIRTSCSSSDHEVVCGSPKRLVLVHSDFRFNTRSVANFSLFPLQILSESEQRLLDPSRPPDFPSGGYCWPPTGCSRCWYQICGLAVWVSAH